jgi:hypothetical protein
VDLWNSFPCARFLTLVDGIDSKTHRSPSWSRSSDEATLDKIASPAGSQIMVPTWSWMAFKGGIDYLELPFDGVDWEKQEIRSPGHLVLVEVGIQSTKLGSSS